MRVEVKVIVGVGLKQSPIFCIMVVVHSVLAVLAHIGAGDDSVIAAFYILPSSKARS